MGLSRLLRCCQKTCKMLLNTLIANLLGRFWEAAVLTVWKSVKRSATLYQIHEKTEIKQSLGPLQICAVETQNRSQSVNWDKVSHWCKTHQNTSIFISLHSRSYEPALINTYERVCASPPWGRIDLGQVSPSMNNQNYLQPFLINIYFDSAVRAAIQYKCKVTIDTPDLFCYDNAHLSIIITTA